MKYIKDKLLYKGKAKKIYSIEGQQFRHQVIMYRTITKILGFLLLTSSAGSLAYDPQYNIHGVRSSFLIKHYTESGIGPGARTNATMYDVGRNGLMLTVRH